MSAKIPSGLGGPISRAVSALEAGTFTKVISGIGSRKARRIRNLAAIYGSAQLNVIDVAPHIDALDAANQGLAWAEARARARGESFERPLVMVSLGLEVDPHVAVPLIDLSVCGTCNECLCDMERFCASRPLGHRNEECLSCMRCLRSCPYDAISIVAPELGNRALLRELLRRGAGAVELHIAGATVAQCEHLWSWVESSIRPHHLVSFSVGSEVTSPQLLRQQLDWVRYLRHPLVVFQAEGHPMGGGADAAALDIAEQVLARSHGRWVQASGGCDLGTHERFTKRGLNVAGLGFGSFARGQVQDVLEDERLDPDDERVEAAIAKARELVHSVQR